MDQCDYISGCDLEFRSYNYEKKNENKKYGTILFLFLFLSFMIFMGYNMGIGNMINTMLNTAYSLLIETVFYIMAIAVMAGALSSLLSELGVISFVDKILSPLMFPIYKLPGAASMGILSTYFSDNPAILALAKDKSFRKYFKKYQLPSITNLGNCRTNCKPNK